MTKLSAQDAFKRRYIEEGLKNTTIVARQKGGGESLYRSDGPGIYDQHIFGVTGDGVEYKLVPSDNAPDGFRFHTHIRKPGETEWTLYDLSLEDAWRKAGVHLNEAPRAPRARRPVSLC